MISIQLKNRTYKVASEWNELSARQLRQLMQLFRSNVLLQEGTVHMLRILLGVSRWKFWRLPAEEIEEFLYLTDFLFAQNTFSKNVLPKYRGFYGPASDFQNLLICEFIFTEAYYRRFRDTKDQTALDMLIAILYRPGKKSYDRKQNTEGDIREPYNDNLTIQFASKISKWPLSAKETILLWYEGCKDNLVNNNPDIFGTGSTEDTAQYGLWSVMRSVAEAGVHGNISQVEKMPVKIFLMELNELLAKSRQIENAQNKISKNG